MVWGNRRARREGKIEREREKIEVFSILCSLLPSIASIAKLRIVLFHLILHLSFMFSWRLFVLLNISAKECVTFSHNHIVNVMKCSQNCYVIFSMPFFLINNMWNIIQMRSIHYSSDVWIYRANSNVMVMLRCQSRTIHILHTLRSHCAFAVFFLIFLLLQLFETMIKKTMIKTKNTHTQQRRNEISK